MTLTPMFPYNAAAIRAAVREMELVAVCKL